MSSNAEEPQSPDLAFARSLGLFDSTMIGVGAMIGAGIFAAHRHRGERRVMFARA